MDSVRDTRRRKPRPATEQMSWAPPTARTGSTSCGTASASDSAGISRVPEVREREKVGGHPPLALSLRQSEPRLAGRVTLGRRTPEQCRASHFGDCADVKARRRRRHREGGFLSYLASQKEEGILQELLHGVASSLLGSVVRSSEADLSSRSDPSLDVPGSGDHR